MRTHILNGDALAESLLTTTIDGKIIVCRECLIEGSVEGETLPEFWQTRADFIGSFYGENTENYRQNVQNEFEKLFQIAPTDEVNLWFEYDLFCQVNLWFILSLLHENPPENLFLVSPTTRNAEDLWRGFGRMETRELEKCLAEKVRFVENDVKLGADLWQAFKTNDLNALEKLSTAQSPCFPHLKEVCRAEIERRTEMRPQKTLQKILSHGINDFGEIFRQFSAQEGIYGFGDSQVKNLLAEI